MCGNRRRSEQEPRGIASNRRRHKEDPWGLHLLQAGGSVPCLLRSHKHRPVRRQQRRNPNRTKTECTLHRIRADHRARRHLALSRLRNSGMCRCHWLHNPVTLAHPSRQNHPVLGPRVWPLLPLNGQMSRPKSGRSRRKRVRWNGRPRVTWASDV
jgi:hypothetical protein